MVLDNWVPQYTQETQDDDEEFVAPTPNHFIVDDDDDSGNEKEDDTPLPKSKPKKRTRLPPKAPKKPSRLRSPWWKTFDEVLLKNDDGEEMRHGKCKFCLSILGADTNKNGTSSLKKHALGCQANPENVKEKEKGQTTLQFKKQDCGEGSSLTTWKHDDARIKRALLNLFVVGELPFKFIENEAFIEYSNALNGRVILPSRHKISRDVSQYFLDERLQYLSYFSNPSNTIHLTTDTWTSSCQKTNYMVVTGHFIDDSWVMHKRILNFRPIDSHKGEDVGRLLLDCIHGWGIKNVMTMTVDNATSNDKALEFLIKKIPNLFDGGKLFHVRCMAHILNLIVKDGLKEHNFHVERVQKAVRYIRHSTARISKFKRCMKECDLEGNKFLCGYCPTRWNSTYELLKTALELRPVFTAYELEDTSYNRDLVGNVLENADFQIIEDIVQFLEKFKTKTENMSSSTKPLIHTFLREIFDVDQHLREWSTKVDFCHMVPEMMSKYDKYWGSFDKLNDYTYFAVLLDPQFKTSFLSYVFKKMVEHTITEQNQMSDSTITLKVLTMVREVERRMEKFFTTYKDRFDNGSSPIEKEVVSCVSLNDFLDGFLNIEGTNSVSMETELKRYLNEPKVQFKQYFDILDWWKKNGIRFPIVARMARDLLAIQVSTVASESAFSTCGRILDEYRTRLNTPIVEALVCTQDWVRKSRKPIVDDVEDIIKDDEVAMEIEEGIKAQDGKGKGKSTIEV